MSDGELTTELQRFIARHIESVEKLEILLILSRHPEKAWSVPEVYQAIQSSIASVTQKLRDLHSEGFAQREANDRFRYQPRTEELREQVQALDAAYQQRRIRVIGAIFSEKTDELRNFANAFKIRKENE